MLSRQYVNCMTPLNNLWLIRDVMIQLLFISDTALTARLKCRRRTLSRAAVAKPGLRCHVSIANITYFGGLAFNLKLVKQMHAAACYKQWRYHGFTSSS